MRTESTAVEVPKFASSAAFYGRMVDMVAGDVLMDGCLDGSIAAVDAMMLPDDVLQRILAFAGPS